MSIPRDNSAFSENFDPPSCLLIVYSFLYSRGHWNFVPSIVRLIEVATSDKWNIFSVCLHILIEAKVQRTREKGDESRVLRGNLDINDRSWKAKQSTRVDNASQCTRIALRARERVCVNAWAYTRAQRRLESTEGRRTVMVDSITSSFGERGELVSELIGFVSEWDRSREPRRMKKIPGVAGGEGGRRQRKIRCRRYIKEAKRIVRIQRCKNKSFLFKYPFPSSLSGSPLSTLRDVFATPLEMKRYGLSKFGIQCWH